MNAPIWIKGTLVIAVTFAAGLVSGIGYERHQARSDHAIAPDAHTMIHRLAADLDLDPAQQQTINQILARHQSEMDSTWDAMQPHVHATLESALQEIAAVLRPDQAAKFRRLTDSGHVGTGH